MFAPCRLWPVVAAAGCDLGPKAPTTPTDTGTPITDTAPTDTPPPPPPPTSGACGDVATWDLQLLGGVARSTGGPASGADVWLEDHGWVPGTVLGTATTDGDGRFEMVITGLTSVEDCWATLLDYRVHAELGSEATERGINTDLFNAIYTGGGVADITAFPLVLEAAR